MSSAHAMDAMDNITDDTKKKHHKEGEFKRQPVLFEAISNYQLGCGHTITLSGSTLMCTTCGAVWFK